MLFFWEGKGDVLVLGSNITIRVLGLGPKKVRLGIIAPKNIGVVRQEIKERTTNKCQQHGNNKN